MDWATVYILYNAEWKLLSCWPWPVAANQRRTRTSRLHLIEVWPLLDLQDTPAKSAPATAKERLIALEYEAYQHLLNNSKFNAVLNEKVPTKPAVRQELSPSLKAKVVTDAVSTLRDHPDLRIARRAATLARLAKVIAERKVQAGLRQTLLTQAQRIVDLAQRRVDGTQANHGAPTSESGRG